MSREQRSRLSSLRVSSAQHRHAQTGDQGADGRAEAKRTRAKRGERVGLQE